MDEDTKSNDQRAGKDRRQTEDPAYKGPERRVVDRRKDKSTPK